MSRYTINISVEIDDICYHFSDTKEVDTDEWDIEGVSSEALDSLAFRAKSALMPCFWEHSMAANMMERDTNDN
jgi:hypothetical protein